MLPIIVVYSFVYLACLSGALFLFIFLRRLLVEARERRDGLVYKIMERDLLEVLTADEPPQAAIEFSQKYASKPRVLKSLLVAYREALAGQALEPLRIIFERTIRAKCLRELGSFWLATRLQNVRLFVDFSRPEEAPHLVRLLHDKPVVRLAVLNALTRIATQDTLNHIFELYETDPSPNLYAYSNIFYGLGQRIEPFVRASLRKPLSVEKTGLLIEMAGRLLLRGLYPEVVGFARHPEKELRIRAARALGRFLVPSSVNVLTALAADEAWEVQAQALRSLGSLQNWKTVPLIAKALFSPHWHVRYNAGFALAAFGLIGVLQLQDISRQKEDRYAADMAAMVLDSVILTGGA